MKKYYNHILLLMSMVMYVALWLIMHPYLGYRLDSDCTAYLSIAEHVANGEFNRSVNGLWSPLNGWLLVPFIKAGINTWLAAKVVNAFIGACVLTIMYMLLVRKSNNHFLIFGAMFILPIIIVYYSYLQLFGDLLQVFFLLIYFYIITSKKYFSTVLNSILSSLCIVLAYYSKAYSLIFFVLHFAASIFLCYKNEQITKSKALQYFILSLAIVIAGILPWSIALHKKYNEWTLTGNAGKLNMSWNIISGKAFKKDISLLIPPTYKDGVSFWEDPYPSQGILYSPTSSISHFIKWIARVLHTSLQAVLCFNEITCLWLAIVLIGLFYFFYVKKDEQDIQIAWLAIVIIPLGYLAMHIETRYIWFATFMLLYVTVSGLDILLSTLHVGTTSIKSYTIKLWSVIFLITFIIFPIYNIKQLKHANKQIFDVAKEYQVSGAFTSNAIDAGFMWVLAYLQRQSFYTIEKTDYTATTLIKEMKRYQIKYYIQTLENKNPDLENEIKLQKIFTYSNGWKLYELSEL